jgi:hypothetical protein
MAKKPALDPALAAILAANGLGEAVEDVEKEKEYADSPEQIKFRGIGVLYALEYPLSPRVTKTCKRESCGSVFLTNYNAVGYCSNECLQKDLSDRYGIKWEPNERGRKERWEVRVPPQIIPMQALRAMKAIVNQAELDLGHPIEIGVSQKPFSVKYPYFGELGDAASESDYKLPALAESPSSASLSEQAPHSLQSLPSSHSLDTTEKTVQSQAPELPVEHDDLFEDLFADLL